MCVYIRAHFRLALIGRNLTAQSTGSYVVASSPSYSRPAARAPQGACLQARWRVTMVIHGEEDAQGRGKRNIRTNHELVRKLVIGLELKLVVCPISIFPFATLELRERRVNFREDFWDCN